MEGKGSYLAVGIFVIGLIVAALAIFFWLTLRKHDQSYTTYAVYLHEEVSGLSVQSAVRYNGVPVGYVKSIDLVPSNPQLVKVLLDIETGTPINTSTVATLMSQGITGVDYIGLQAQQVNAPPLMVHKGEDYPVIPSKPSLLMQLSEVMPEITRKITQLSDSISKLFDQQNTDSISATLQNLKVFTTTLKDNSANLTASMNSLNKLLANARDAAKGLPKLVKSTSSTMKALHNTATEFSSTAVTAKTTLNTLSQQLMPSAQQVLQQLNNVAVNFESLSGELDRNPSILVRGKKLATPGPGEK